MTGQNLYRTARKRIPGGVQLLSKRPEMFLPEQWPSYYREARGAEVWDLDGNRYVDMSYSAVGSCSLGYADPDVEAAVVDVVRRGSMCTLNAPEEVSLADLLCEIHPWADMVRYGRCGGEGMSIAVRIARARTRKDKIVFCGYHGWTDWYLAANLAEDTALDGHLLPGLAPAGVPRGLTGTAIPFRYNDLSSFHEALQTAGPDLAAVVMEPLRSAQPDPGFLETIREETRRRNALLVFDEVTAAWRLNSGGVHLLGSITPDIAVFAKALSNGYPMSAIIGTGDAMQAAQDTFVSSTYWTERIGPTAALTTVQKHRKVDASKHMIAMGERVQSVWRKAAEQTGLDITVAGIAPLSRFTFNVPNAQTVKTLFTQMMLDRGYLASNAFYAMYAHTPEQVDAYGVAVAGVFKALRDAIEAGTVEKDLRGPVAHTGFARLA